MLGTTGKLPVTYPYAAKSTYELPKQVIRSIILPLFTTIRLLLATLYSPVDFCIISSHSNSIDLLLQESQLILRERPTLNSHTSSIQLTLFWILMLLLDLTIDFMVPSPIDLPLDLFVSLVFPRFSLLILFIIFPIYIPISSVVFFGWISGIVSEMFLRLCQILTW